MFWKRDNRSQASVGSSSGEHLPAAKLEHHEAATQQRYQRPEQHQAAHGQSGVTRSASQSQSNSTQLQRPPIDVAAALNTAGEPRSPNIPTEQRNSYSYQVPQQPSPAQEPRRGLRSRLGLGHTSKETVDQSYLAAPSNKGVGRTVSLRRKETPVVNKYSPTQTQQSQHWPATQSSNQRLSSSNDNDESTRFDPFLVRDDEPSPAVPAKDSPVSQRPEQQYQYQFAPPPLARSGTDRSHQTQGASEQYNQVDQDTTHQRPPQYRTYSDQNGPVNHQQQYQAFQPPPTAGSNAAHTIRAVQQPADQSIRYSYHQQPSAQQYAQEGDRQSQLQPEGQYFQLERPSSQQQGHTPPETLQLQPARTPAQQQQQQQDLRLQPGRPPSQQQQYNPPSPLPGYQTSDNTIQPQPPPVPPHGTDPQASNNLMPPSGLSSYQQMSKPGDTNKQTTGSSPQRDGSNMAPGQGSNPTFGANVVPSGSQGQPYRGGQAQLQQDSEQGRSTPPPRSATEPTDDKNSQFNQLLREHKELRDKYNHVKKRYFEKENQVHQLQNTLAHQRLSQSRTSLDDSEYGARFERLHGLISQLALGIRKNWKTIPEAFQPAVNRDANATGTKEMIALGRAFISAWLVEEVFERYFHPDLEPGLSMQLKQIQHNIRRSCPPFQSSDEEDGLVAKIISWRLTTLEGLVELLKGPQATTNRQALIEMLNEKLIAAMQMYLHDPAPPELNGGVYMIVELAVNIAVHLPLESREVHIQYFPPGHAILADHMKLESGITALTNPIVDVADTADKVSLKSTASDLKDSATTSSADEPSPSTSVGPGQKDQQEQKQSRKGMFGGLMGSKKPTSKQVGGGGSQVSLTQQQQQQPPKEEMQAPPRVRLAVGVAVEVRGKNHVLVKAPVYSTA